MWTTLKKQAVKSTAKRPVRLRAIERQSLATFLFVATPVTACTLLTGNTTQECGGCPASVKCNPGAPDYAGWEARAEAAKQREAAGVKDDVDNVEHSMEVKCMDHCLAEGCEAFIGNLTEECGACSASVKCNPAADGFDTWIERRKLQVEL